MKFWSGLVMFVRTLWRTHLGSVVFDAIKRLLRDFALPKINELTVLARQKVEEVEAKYPDGGQGIAKFDEVFDFLLTQAESWGLTISASSLGFLIEAALQAFELEQTGGENAPAQARKMAVSRNQARRTKKSNVTKPA